jgi:hypothetical protein
MKSAATELRSINQEIRELLKNYLPYENVTKKNVSDSTYIVQGEGFDHGDYYIEFTHKGTGYRFNQNAYTYSPELKSGARSVVYTGYERNQYVCLANPEKCSRLFELATNAVIIYNKAVQDLRSFFRDEAISPK